MRLGREAEMLVDVGARAEQALLFAGPEGDADGAARLEVERLRGCARLPWSTATPAPLSVAPVPECHESMCAAEHDDLVLQIGAGNLGDGVVGHEIVVVELHLRGPRPF